jgi:hypothetical protein
MTVLPWMYKISRAHGIQFAVETNLETGSKHVVVGHSAMQEDTGLRMTMTTLSTRWLAVRRRCVRMTLPLLCILLLIGCGRAGSTPVAITPAAIVPLEPTLATPLPATPAVQEPRFSEIVWTTEWSGAPGEEPVSVAELRTDSPAIIALVRGRMLPNGAQVNAAWTYNDTSLDAFATQTTTSGASDDVWLAFRLDRTPDLLWPAGTYQVTLTFDGAEVASDAVLVVESP